MLQPSTQKPAAAPPPKPAETQSKPTSTATQPAQTQPKADAAGATGYQAAGVQDGFEAQRATTQRPQGDTFEQASGGGAAAPVAGAGQAVGSAVASGIDNLASLKSKDTIAKLADIGQPAVEANPSDRPDPQDPTAGMTEEERAAYDALPPEQRQRYDELHEQAAETWKFRTVGPDATIVTPSTAVDHLQDLLTSGDFDDYLAVEQALQGPENATALRDVQELLFQGKLNGSPRSSTGTTVLDAMVGLAQGGETSQGVDRTQLLGQLAHDINHPEQIEQGRNNNDCGGSTAAFLMALTEPAEYARMIQGLGENGRVEMTPAWARLFGASSNVMQLNEPFDPKDQRSITQQLFAKTFDTEAVSGNQPVTAAEQAQAEQAAAEGITGEQLEGGLNDKGVLGGGWDSVYLPPPADPNNPNDKVSDAQRAETARIAGEMIDGATPEKPVMVNVNNHWLTVLGQDSQGNYWVHDPLTGEIQRKSRDELTEGLSAVVYQTRNHEGEVPDYMHNPAWAEPGGGGPTSGGTTSSGGGGSTN